mmetsp:Transcript_10300/g.42621  ORF Transcript_10300/g.42621 Transcript_10300/m.42621 type:complete len:203 (+) Transcript_10300:1158-1766(+)
MASISDSISKSRWKNSLTKMRRAITEQCTTMSCSNFLPAGPDTISPFSPLSTTPPPGRSAPEVIRPIICMMSFSKSSPSINSLAETLGVIESQKKAVNMLKAYLEAVKACCSLAAFTNCCVLINSSSSSESKTLELSSSLSYTADFWRVSAGFLMLESLMTGDIELRASCDGVTAPRRDLGFPRASPRASPEAFFCTSPLMT